MKAYSIWCAIFVSLLLTASPVAPAEETVASFRGSGNDYNLSFSVPGVRRIYDGGRFHLHVLSVFGSTRPGLACGNCHGGDFFTDERNTIVGFPQIGLGKGDGPNGDEDFGREQQTANAQDRFMFRTPTLLNLLATPPYGHSGSLSFFGASAHYFIPEVTFNDELPGGSVCGIEQFASHPDWATLFPNVVGNSSAALQAAIQQRNIDPSLTFPDLFFSPQSDAPLVFAFLEALTDPCTLDRTCLAPWIPDPAEAPDSNQLNAVDANGNPL